MSVYRGVIGHWLCVVCWLISPDVSSNSTNADHINITRDILSNVACYLLTIHHGSSFAWAPRSRISPRIVPRRPKSEHCLSNKFREMKNRPVSARFECLYREGPFCFFFFLQFFPFLLSFQYSICWGRLMVSTYFYPPAAIIIFFL